ncbi:hypothetical protein [Longitalea arenae]|uniref:hypothetical protein n=1 Tax=Longitalea arenae TaxID=2812558 RepID=UPI00196894D2|nr:hypothetical protein [Longitalea arenae]
MQKRIIRLLALLFSCCLLQYAHGQCIIDDLVKDLNDAKTPQSFKDFIKGNSEGMMAYKKLSVYPQIRKDAEVLNATSKFLSRHADFMTAHPGKFENIISNLRRVGVRCNTCVSGVNKGIPALNVIIDDMDWALTAFKNKNVDIQKVFTEMATQGGLNYTKADGGAYMLNVLKTNAAQDADYISSITKFEYQYLDDGSFEADVFRTVGDQTHLSEFKSYTSTSWEGFSYADKNVRQFAAYIKSNQKFEYFANVAKLSEVPNPAELVKNQFLKIFKDNAKVVFDPASPLFKNITYNGKTINITTYKQLENLAGNADFINSSLFNFVKVY